MAFCCFPGKINPNQQRHAIIPGFLIFRGVLEELADIVDIRFSKPLAPNLSSGFYLPS